MELQCCGEFEAGRECRIKNLTVQKYLEFCELHKHSDLTEVLVDAVDSIQLMELTRSTITDDNLSSNAFITSEEAIKDLTCLNWIECSVTSFKTFNSVNDSLKNAKDVALKSKTEKKKPQKMSRLKDVAERACSLASGDQFSAKGDTGDCAAADLLSLSSLLTTETELPNMRRSENIVNPACYLASGDQCYAKGNTSDSEASDDLTLSSFLTTIKKRPKKRRLEDTLKPACSLASGDQNSAKMNIGKPAASDHLSLSWFLPEAGEQVLQALTQTRPSPKRHTRKEFQKKKEMQQSTN
uniref:Uncharacterized protein n=1 Tax=Daucus carota subsp. sativus TaxID=79200 RepID=A0A165Z0P2_DAUCS